MKEELVIHKMFARVSSQYPDRVCFQIKKGPEWERWAYKQIEDLSLRVGAFLIGQGYKKGDFAAICLENRPEWGVIYLGIMAAGLTCVPLDPQLAGKEIENLINDCAAKIIFVSNAVFQAKKIDTLKGGLNKIVILDLDIEKDNLIGMAKAGSVSSEGVIWPEVSSEDVASLIYTSGTTGTPKGVMLTHKNLCSNFQSLDKMKIFSDKDNFIAVLPLHHAFPFMLTLLLPLFLRSRVTYASSLRTDELLASMREAGVTVLPGVPQLFYMFYTQISARMKKIPFLIRLPIAGMIEILWQIRKLSGINISKLVLPKIHRPFGEAIRFFVSGGAKLNEEAGRFLVKIGFTILEGYGLTETSPGVAFNPLRKQKIGSVGKLFPDVEVKIVDPDATGMGEVVIKGPNVMKGYYKRPDDTASVLKDGWFYSGDLGHIDKDGYLYITGRKKEMIVLSSGKKIFPDEIEAHYARNPYIKEICVVGVGEEGAEEEKLAAVVVPNPEYYRKLGEVNLHSKLKWELENISDGLAAYQRIKGFIIIKEDIPRTRMGKIMRYEVKKKYLDELKGAKAKGAAEEVPATDEDLAILASDTGRKVAEALTKHAKLERKIGPADHLELDLGIDSLGRVELLMALEQALNKRMPDELLTKVFTVKELILEIEKLSPGGEAQGSASQAKRQASWNEILSKEPEEDIIRRLYLTPNRMAGLAMRLFTGTLRLIFKAFWRLRASGTENIPKKGKCILCVNHASYLDGFVVMASVPARLRKDLFIIGFGAFFDHFFIRNTVKYIRAIPIDPGTHLIESMQASSYVLRHDKMLCIFPEGERTIDGKVQEFKKGVGILAKELNVPLVPVYIDGSYESWPRTRRFPRPHPIKITFGRPFNSEELKTEGLKSGAKDDYEAIAFGIREEVVKLK
ncbi:MAG: AMP-binding protein [Candidatus Omnitrophota bacterium]